MNYEDWQKIKEVFNHAVELPIPDREAFLQNEAELNGELREEVRRLLTAEQENHLEHPLINFSDLWEQEEIESLIGKKIGNYKIMDEVGRGGIGVVYKATREMPDFVQTAALKLLKRGMDSDFMLSRFRHERRILASLEHPHIARLLDGGVAENGLSFLAMEFVEGVPIDEYCRENNLSITERLQIFLQVCAAVSFAHSRLVVHRDLKPSNILVTADGSVKLLDFGIAKIISPEDGSMRQTITQFRMMTPAYASPEQIRGELVSTASDIYSLGLILYELLTGAAAYKFASSRADEIAKVICEYEPLRPSSVIGGQPATKNSTRSHEAKTTRGSSHSTKHLKGDLDNIVLKALRKEPVRRYVSVEQFANDIKRHLEGLPVIARPDTFKYRLEKFVARNKVPVAAGALIVMSLIGGIGATSWQARRAEKERVLAQKRFDQVRELANNSVFKYYDQIKDLQGATAARETLIKDAALYLDRLAQDSQSDPTLQKDLVNAYFRLGDILGAPSDAANTGETAAALENYQKAQRFAENLLSRNPDDWEIRGKLRAINTKLGETFQRMGKAEETKIHFRAAVDLSHEIADHEPESPKQLSALGQSYILYGETLPLGTGENESVNTSSKGFPYLEKAIQIAPNDSPSLQRLNMAHIRVGLQIYALARDAEEGGDVEKSAEYYAQAAEYFRRSKAEAEKLTATEPNNAGFRRRLFAANFNESISLSGLQKTDEALKIQKEVINQTTAAAADAKNAEAQFDLAQSYYEIGNTFFRRGEYPEANENIEKAIGIYNKITAADASNVQVQRYRFEAQIKYGTIKIAEKNYSTALETFNTALDELKSSTAGKDAAYLSFAEGWIDEKIGDNFAAQNDQVHAREQYQKAVKIWENEKASPVNQGYSQAKINYLREKATR